MQTQVQEMLPRAAIAVVTPNADAMEMLPRVAIAVATPAAEAMFSTLPLAAVVRAVDKGEEAFACPRETVSLLGLPLGVLAANGILAGEVSATSVDCGEQKSARRSIVNSCRGLGSEAGHTLQVPGLFSSDAQRRGEVLAVRLQATNCIAAVLVAAGDGSERQRGETRSEAAT